MGLASANLRHIEKAKLTWASEYNKMKNAVPRDAELFGELGYIRQKPVCLEGGAYTLGAVSEKPRSSIPGHTI